VIVDPLAAPRSIVIGYRIEAMRTQDFNALWRRQHLIFSSVRKFTITTRVTNAKMSNIYGDSDCSKMQLLTVVRKLRDLVSTSSMVLT
jgi:hypothetical protein